MKWNGDQLVHIYEDQKILIKIDCKVLTGVIFFLQF